MSKKLISRDAILIIATVFLILFITLGFAYIQVNDNGKLKLNDNGKSALKTLFAFSKKRPPLSESERNIKYDAIFAAVLERNPELQITWHPVKDETNGYRQWLMFKKQVVQDMTNENGTSSFHEELNAILSDSPEWDYDGASALMAKYSDLLDEMTAIGQLPDASAAGIPLQELGEFTSIIEARELVRLLMAGSRFAAESNDTQLALSRLNAASQISSYYQSVEASSFTDATIGIVSRLHVLESNMQHILPNLELSPAELSALRQNWQNKNATVSMQTLIRSEFSIGMRSSLIPIITNGAHNGLDISEEDTDALYDAIAQQALSAIQQLDNLSERDLYKLQQSGLKSLDKSSYEYLSSDALEVLALNSTDTYTSYLNGILRTQVVYNQHDAAMAFLANEPIPVEPITGKPYIFDQSTNTLSLPDDDMLKSYEIKPIKLP